VPQLFTLVAVQEANEDALPEGTKIDSPVPAADAGDAISPLNADASNEPVVPYQ
jgi:hypothetical protein